MPELASQEFDGRPARSVDILTGMLGWNSVAVFKAGEHRDGDRLKVNKATVFVMLADPWPEFSTVVFIDGEFHHEGYLLATEYEAVFEDHLDDYGEAEIVPLSEIRFLQRDEGGIPCYVDTDTEPVTDGGRDLDGRQAFLAGDAHYCDICSRPFDSWDELANHDCRPVVTDGGRSEHRADCEDCPWSYSNTDLIDVSDEMERHARKEMHDVDLERAVATDGGNAVGGPERERTIRVNVISTVEVPEQHLNEGMSEEEITSQILKHGELDSNEALAESISEIRKRAPDTKRDGGV